MALKLTLALSLASSVAAHGFVKTIVADGVTYKGYDPSFQYQNPIPVVAGWSDPQDISNGFVNDYSNPDIACHLGATPGKAYATVSAGGSVQVEWTPWPDSHKGPVIDYLAACNGDCTNADKTTLLWNKIAAQGLIDGSTVPGKFAADVLVQSGNKWTINIPSFIAPGNYVLRHEIIALHEGGRQGGAQNYPQCINLKVTGSGTNTLSGTGTLYNKLYTQTDPGILCNIYQQLSSYVIPGPALLSTGSGSGSTQSSSSKPQSTSATVSAPSTFQTSTRATTTLVVSDSSTKFSGGTSTVIASPSGPARKFICYEEL